MLILEPDFLRRLPFLVDDDNDPVSLCKEEAEPWCVDSDSEEDRCEDRRLVDIDDDRRLLRVLLLRVSKGLDGTSVNSETTS